MEFLQMFVYGFGIYMLRALSFPFFIIGMILLLPLRLFTKNRTDDKFDWLDEFYDKAFMVLFGPPFGFFSVGVCLWIGLVYWVVNLL